MISKIISHTISTPSGSESESESFLENEDQNWLTCAGELSYLVEDLKNASDLIDKVKSDTCPAVETFLVNVEKITQRICKNASKIRKISSALLKEIEEKKASALIEKEIVVSVPCHDPAERCKVSSLTEKKYLVKLGPHQPKLSVFPQHEDIPPRKTMSVFCCMVLIISTPGVQYIERCHILLCVLIISIRTWQEACRFSMVDRWYATMAQNDQSRN